MPPELRARAEKMIESGEHEALTRVVKRRWTPSDGVPSPEVLATVQEQFPGARPEWTGKSLVVRRRSRGKMLLLFLAVLMAGLALLLIRLWVTLRRPSGSRHFGKALQKLEGTFEKDPEDLELGLRLTQAYARKLILVNTLQGMREHGPDPSDELAAQWTASVTQMEKLTGLSGSKEELRETGAKAETLARQLLSRDDLTQSQRSTVLILLGHFLLAQGRTDDALEASREATELHPDDVRPHLLNAAVYETTKEYDRGMRENGQALSKLAAWIREDPTSLHYLVWRAGPDAPPDDPLLRPENVNAGIRQGIEMHNMLLRALAKADDMPR
jgi:tetratricopeptide (TPR) repeat protein